MARTKKTKTRPSDKIILGLQQAVAHAETSKKDYEDGFAAGRIAMQGEMDEMLIEGLATLTSDSKSKTPVLISHATAQAITRFWRKHREPLALGKYTAPAAPVQGEELKAGEHTPTPWAYRPNEYDDWGWIRGSDGALAAIARNSKSCDDFDEHRRAGTDPYGANAALIVAAVNSYVARREESRAAYQRIDELETALKAILAANDDFAAGMPSVWEGDLLQDACDDARKLLPLEPFPAESGA